MRTLLLLPFLAACAAPGVSSAPGVSDVMPRQTVLYRDTVTVEMSDGTFCAGVREAGSGPWSRRLAGCPHTWPLTVLRTAPVARLPLAPSAGDPWVTLAPPDAPPIGLAPAAVAAVGGA